MPLSTMGCPTHARRQEVAIEIRIDVMVGCHFHGGCVCWIQFAIRDGKTKARPP